jgi:hypothetical protein
MKYSVLIKPKMMLRIDGIEADSQEEAAVKANEFYCQKAIDLLQRDLDKFETFHPSIVFRYVEPSEGEFNTEALVDEVGDEWYENSEWYIVHDDEPENVIVDNEALRRDLTAVYKKHRELQKKHKKA